MNSLCFGTLFRSLRKYRCMYDGKFIPAEEMPEICSSCGRKVEGKILECSTVRQVLSYQVEFNGGYEEYQRVEVNTCETGGLTVSTARKIPPPVESAPHNQVTSRPSV